MPYSGLNPNYKHVGTPSIKRMLGTGCTDGELCIRFASEDLRQPIMRDNALDEAIFKKHVEKHRLEQWLKATVVAVRQSNENERNERQAALQQVADVGEDEAVAVQQVEETVEESVEAVEGIEVISEENFLGDDEESVAEGDDDVEMQDS
jgi:nuclear pore complex protein Nup133